MYLSVFHDFEILAQTGQAGLTSIQPAASINDAGKVALVGNVSGGQGVFGGISPAVDVAVLSATTADSQSVSFQLQVSGSPVGQFEVAVYRSANAVFDAADVRLQSKSYFNVSPGVYSEKINVPLVIDPAHPYVFAVADPEGHVAETNEANNSAFFQKYVVGVVTHGLELSGQLPQWVTDTANFLAAPDGGQYNAAIAFDWAATSRIPLPGIAVQRGKELASYVASFVAGLNTPSGSAVDIHWIGHSRGAVVISQALAALETRTDLPEAIQRGYVKMTFLDPHPAHNHQPPLFSTYFNPLNPKDPLNLVGVLVGAAFSTFQALARDPEVSVPAVADEAEVYYQERPSILTGTLGTPYRQDFFLNVWGEEPVAAAAGFRGTIRYEDLTWREPKMSHSLVHEWYRKMLGDPSVTIFDGLAGGLLPGGATSTQVAASGQSRQAATDSALLAAALSKINQGPASDGMIASSLLNRSTFTSVLAATHQPAAMESALPGAQRQARSATVANVFQRYGSADAGWVGCGKGALDDAALGELSDALSIGLTGVRKETAKDRISGRLKA